MRSVAKVRSTDFLALGNGYPVLCTTGQVEDRNILVKTTVMSWALLGAAGRVVVAGSSNTTCNSTPSDHDQPKFSCRSQYRSRPITAVRRWST